MTKAGVPRDDVSRILKHVDRGARGTRSHLINLARERATDEVYQPSPEIGRQIGVTHYLSNQPQGRGMA
jgi:hypothetical protein